LARGDLFAKLGRKEQALACYRAAESLAIRDPECRERVQQLVRAALDALDSSDDSAGQ
jgi:predicted RNA polymerase sigma factor